VDVNLEALIRLTGLVAAALNIWGFVVISEVRTKLIFSFSSIFWGIQYLLLGSMTGTTIMLLASIRQGVSIYSYKMNMKERLFWSSFFSISAVIITVTTGQIWYYAFIPLSATLIGTWSFFFSSNETIRQWTLLSNGLWGIHAYVFQSWELLFCMIALTAANAYGLFKIRNKSLTNVV
jgi:hypothetical protein